MGRFWQWLCLDERWNFPSCDEDICIPIRKDSKPIQLDFTHTATCGCYTCDMNETVREYLVGLLSGWSIGLPVYAGDGAEVLWAGRKKGKERVRVRVDSMTVSVDVIRNSQKVCTKLFLSDPDFADRFRVTINDLGPIRSPAGSLPGSQTG